MTSAKIVIPSGLSRSSSSLRKAEVATRKGEPVFALEVLRRGHQIELLIQHRTSGIQTPCRPFEVSRELFHSSALRTNVGTRREESALGLESSGSTNLSLHHELANWIPRRRRSTRRRTRARSHRDRSRPPRRPSRSRRPARAFEKRPRTI